MIGGPAVDFTLSEFGPLRAHRPFALGDTIAFRCGTAQQRDLDGDTEHALVVVPVQTRRANSKAFEQEGTPEREIHLNAMEVSARTGKS